MFCTCYVGIHAISLTSCSFPNRILDYVIGDPYFQRLACFIIFLECFSFMFLVDSTKTILTNIAFWKHLTSCHSVKWQAVETNNDETYVVQMG